METDIQPWQQRVIDEYKELQEKRAKLDAFIAGPAFKQLHPQDAEDLHEQRIAMSDYAYWLTVRINRFGKDRDD